MSLLLLAAALAVPIPPNAVLLDGVAAVVEREVITRSDVERSARLALARKGGMQAARMQTDDALRDAILNMLVVEELVLLDARRNQRFPETDEQVALQAARVRALFRSDEEFHAFLTLAQMTENEFLERMRREVRVDLILAEHMASGPITDDEIAFVLQSRPDLRSDDVTMSRMRARAVIQQQRQNASAVAYIDALRARTAIKIVERKP